MKNTVVKCREEVPPHCSLKPSCLTAEPQALLTLQRQQKPDSCWSWVICLSASILNILVIGLSYSYGVLFPVLLAYFKRDRATTAWVGSAFVSASFLFGPIAANLCNRYGCRFTAISGSVISILGLLLTSQAPSIYTMFVSFSLVVGFGCCCMYTTCFVIVPRVFQKRRSLAFGLVSLGPSIGVLIMAPLLQCLVDSLGWRKTFLVLAGITTLICLICFTFDSKTLKDMGESSLSLNYTDEVANDGLDTSIFRNKRYVVFLVTAFMLFLGTPTVQVYLVEFSGTLSISAHDASTLYMYIGVVSTISRLLSGQICDSKRVNTVYIFTTACFTAGTSIILLSHSSKYTHLAAFAVVYGFSDGILCVVIGVMLLSSVSRTQRSFGMGVYLASTALPLATASPLIGFLIDTFGTYSPGFYFCGLCVIISGFCAMMVLFVKPLTDETERPENSSSSTVETYFEYKPMIEKMTVV